MNFKDINWPDFLFVTGIGTDVGKTYATGWLAREISKTGQTVVTQKLIQTGCIDESEDIIMHRKIMGGGLLTVDHTNITAPLIYKYPASPHLAAKIEKSDIKLELIDEASRILKKQFGHVLIEGAGGLMTPLKGDKLTADYIKEHKMPTLVVTNGRLGSISDTLLNLYALAHYGIEIFGVIYNPYFDKDKIIAEETRIYLKDWLAHHYPDALWFEMPVI